MVLVKEFGGSAQKIKNMNGNQLFHQEPLVKLGRAIAQNADENLWSHKFFMNSKFAVHNCS